MGEYEDKSEALMKKWKPFIKVGDVYDRYRELPEGHPNRYQFQVRGIVDEDQYVVRRWLSSKGYWYYQVLWLYELALNLESKGFVLLEEHEYDAQFRDSDQR